MPVEAKGKKIVEVSTGKVKGVAKSAKAAKQSAAIRNKAIRGKSKVNNKVKKKRS